MRIFALVVGTFLLLSAHAQGAVPDYTRIVEDVGASVVHIHVQRAKLPAPDSGTGPTPPSGQEGGSEPKRDKALRGSGAILTSDGYVVTTGSNLERAETITITLADGREFPGKIVGIDKQTDIGLVKIEGTALRPIRFADVRMFKTGQRVLLVGAAFAKTTTVADGIISHHSRTGYPPELGGALIPYVATTVPVHPGNGGGILFDAYGDAVGMVTQMSVTRSDSFATISFALPGDVIRSVTDSLRKQGYVSRSAIRITVGPVTKEVADAAGMAKPLGALVSGTQTGGPADRAGIVAGDIILQFNEQPVNGPGDIPGLVAQVRPGTRVPVQVWRNRARMNLTVEVEELAPAR